MVNKVSTTERQRDWRNFLLLGFVGLPITAFLAICGYGFIVWFMQLLFLGAPQ